MQERLENSRESKIHGYAEVIRQLVDHESIDPDSAVTPEAIQVQLTETLEEIHQQGILAEVIKAVNELGDDPSATERLSPPAQRRLMTAVTNFLGKKISAQSN